MSVRKINGSYSWECDDCGNLKIKQKWTTPVPAKMSLKYHKRYSCERARRNVKSVKDRRKAHMKRIDMTDNGGSYVYIIHETLDYESCKIGKADDPFKRLGSLQGGNKRCLVIHKAYELPNAESAHFIESEAHKDLAEYKIRGEWYKVPLGLAREIIESRIDELKHDS